MFAMTTKIGTFIHDVCKWMRQRYAIEQPRPFRFSMRHLLSFEDAECLFAIQVEWCRTLFSPRTCALLSRSVYIIRQIYYIRCSGSIGYHTVEGADRLNEFLHCQTITRWICVCTFSWMADSTSIAAYILMLCLLRSFFSLSFVYEFSRLLCSTECRIHIKPYKLSSIAQGDFRF